MGLFDFIKSQFIEVIEAADMTPDMLVYRFPVQDNEIKMGAQLTVRESQFAVFINEGVMADVFGPGRYELSTENMPVLTKLKSWKYGFNSPFKAEVYFVSSRVFVNQKWGTQKPVLMRDAEFGMIRLSAFGVFSFRVTDPAVFLREVFGTLSSFTTDDINGYLRRMLVSGLADLIGEQKTPVIDLVQSYDELGAAGLQRLQPSFAAIGLELSKVVVESISLPEEVEKTIDKRTSMGVLGDMGQYTRYQSAEAIRDFAQNEGGGNIAGMGLGLGAGVQVGQAFAGAMGENLRPAAALEDSRCAVCGSAVPAGSKFCPECGKPAALDKKPCPSCGASVPPDSKFCPECGKPLAVTCPNCGAAVTGKFCPQCGQPRP
ncbi:MAG: zinc-ribbon domain-containing protein [Clostridiales bacterium]|jgi:membrane protease subunit (stomatin/prohibitin family)|nr:zinc-ribbon domain-containing protein [Clostridiales bacterium]